MEFLEKGRPDMTCARDEHLRHGEGAARGVLGPGREADPGWQNELELRLSSSWQPSHSSPRDGLPLVLVRAARLAGPAPVPGERTRDIQRWLLPGRGRDAWRRRE